MYRSSTRRYRSVARSAPHEVPAHRADELLQRPDARPLADRVRERGAVRGQVGREHVVHVRPVVHHEHDGRMGRHARETLVVAVPDPHAVQRLGDAPGEPVADPEVEVGVERRHDLGGVLAHLLGRERARHVLRCGLGRGRLLHLRVVDQHVDQRLAPRALERAHLDLELAGDLVEHAVRPIAQQPAPARAHHAVVDAERGEDGDRNREPGGQGDRHPARD